MGTTGIEETDTGLRAYFEDSTNPEVVQARFGHLAVSIQTQVPAVAVVEASDREPLLVGRRFVIVPADRIALPIDAGMAFGSGRHETTQLCLEALERCCVPGQTVVDVGCGSGILALAAQKLGAKFVVAGDIDEAAVGVARRHFSGPLFVGSADCLRSAAADVVISNITNKVNDHIAADLKRITKAGGRIIISGFLTGSGPENFHADLVLESGSWECWVCNPEFISMKNAPDHPNDHQLQWWL